MRIKKLVVLPLLVSPIFFAATLWHKDTATGTNMGRIAGPEENYKNYCAGCHGEKMDAFADRSWKHGSTRDDLFRSIKKGWADEGMPAFDSTFTDQETYALADYILKGIKNVDRYKGGEKPRSAVFKTETMTVRLDTVVKGLEVPWGMAFLPKGAMLVTDRNGQLYHVDAAGRRNTVSGLPDLLAKGQGGLMDVAVDPNFATNGFVYLTYSKSKQEGGVTLATTAVAKGRLNGNQLTNVQDIFVAQPYARTQHHYGSRLQFGKDGLLYISVGDRGNEKENPQQLKANDLGKIHRIKTDGSTPGDNPFVKTAGASGSIWSYGHRNPQGMAVDPATGQLWSNEHGPRGGDEINLVKKGQNYGWPVVTYGINYNGKTISNLSKKEGIEDAMHFWLPSIGVSGMAFVSGSRYPAWTGNILSGSLRFQYLNRSVVKNNKVVHEEILFRNIGRLRDVRMGPDGFIYIAVESPGIIYRLVPVKK